LLATTVAVGRPIAAFPPAFRPLSATSLGWGSDRSNPGLNPSFTTDPTEQPGLGLAEHDELCVVLGHTQEIKDRLLRLAQ
jgi:hypothetical protein